MKDIFTALVTPFLEDLSIDYTGLDHLITLLMKQGNRSFLLCGTTGEASSLTIKERKEIVDHVLKTYSDIQIIVGISSNNTTQVIQHIRMYQDDPRIFAFLVLVPYYVRPNQSGIYKHFDAIASSTAKNIIIYNIPSRCGVSINQDTVISLAQKHPNMIGIKQCGPIKDMIEVKKSCKDFLIYVGDDHLLLEGLKEGADGIISVTSHLDYPLIENICKKQNVFDDQYLKLLSDYVFIEPSPAPIKYILSEFGYIQNRLRLPLTVISQESEAIIKPLIEKYKK